MVASRMTHVLTPAAQVRLPGSGGGWNVSRAAARAPAGSSTAAQKVLPPGETIQSCSPPRGGGRWPVHQTAWRWGGWRSARSLAGSVAGAVDQARAAPGVAPAGATRHVALLDRLHPAASATIGALLPSVADAQQPPGMHTGQEGTGSTPVGQPLASPNLRPGAAGWRR